MQVTPSDEPLTYLERQGVHHAAELFAVLQDAAMYRYVVDTPPESLEWFVKRLQFLEIGKSPDGTELWLNWVVRHRCGQLVGYVQATVTRDLWADIAYMFNSEFWGHNVAYLACLEMFDLLRTEYSVCTVYAVTSAENSRSKRLLVRLQFEETVRADYPGEPVSSSETVWRKKLLRETRI
ncbi:GNAT family N-acetyltransferase [Methyloversatilis sp. RAC08]|uniref:GNAT family N-acetyltransferase n=1 Tax=Methyloversatilis sp. RAC08 TaxID=1842540 RepID=UPI0009F59CD4|nr:GNAT family N-acetyltransferase [Methyloversatilis sp. RAC08]